MRTQFNIGKPWTLSPNHPQYRFQLYVRTKMLDVISELSLNSHPAVVMYLLKHRHLINWFHFSRNTSPIAVGFLLKNREKICWNDFSANSNPAAVRLLLKHPKAICWWELAVNENILAVKKLLEHPELIDYSRLNTNSCQLAVEHLLNNPDKIEYFHFAINSNPAAVDHIINSKQIDILRSRFQLNTNPVATEYTLKHLIGNINNLGSNPSIFVLDYPAMSSIRMRQLDGELCAAIYVPKRMSLLLTHHLEHGDILAFC